jgi:two-component system LytT family response regulator
MLKAIIIDDEERFRTALKKILSDFPHYKIIGEAGSVQEALEIINSKEADILFLDIELTDGTGFDIIDKIDASDYKIIFTTGHSEYAVKAFRYSAIDYLLKPIDKNELKNALEKVQSIQYAEKLRLQLKTLRDNKDSFKKIAVPSQSGMEIIEIDTIMYCSSESNYTYFYLENGKSMLSAKVLKDYEELFKPHDFIRVHKSHLVNPKFIKNTIKVRVGI